MAFHSVKSRFHVLNMKLTQLRYISAVAEEGSFSGAARTLGVAQPALSQQISLLEEELGSTLFLRSQSGAEPTQSGLILIEHAQRILEQVELARHDTLTNGSEPSGEVSLVMANAISGAVLPILVSEVAQRFPKITLRVQSDTSPNVQLALENGRSDLGILPDRPSLKKVNAKPFISQSLYFISKPGSSRNKLKEPSISLEQCVTSPLALVRVGQPFRQQLEDTAKDHALTLNVRYQTNSLQMIKSYVESGLASSILPWCAVEEKVLLGKVQARLIKNPVITQSYIVAWPKIRPLNLPSQAVSEILIGTVAGAMMTST